MDKQLILRESGAMQVQALVAELQAAGGSSCRIGQPLLSCMVAPPPAGVRSLVEARDGQLVLLDPLAPAHEPAKRSKHFCVDHCITASSEAGLVQQLHKTVGKV